MIQKGKCLNCWNEIYVHDCHFQCPHCGYAENWSEDSTYQLDKEKKDGDMPKMQVQYTERIRGRERKTSGKKIEKNRISEVSGYKKAW